MINVTLPTGLALNDWADQVVLDLSSYGVFGRLGNANEWQNWAAQFLNNATIGGNLPMPYQFTDWKDWAERFCQTLT